MTPNCHRHTWELADGTCQECGWSYCASCLVHAGGDASRCVPCALAVAGVRRTRHARMGWRQRRAIAKLGA